MKYSFICLFLISFSQIFSQANLPDNYILPLPEGLNSSKVDLDNIKKAIDRLHTFSEYIYNPVKISRTDFLSYAPKNLTDAGNNNRWGAGSWGRGLFSKYVDRFLIDGTENSAYNAFYREHPDTNLRNHFWGTHPIVSYCARTTMAYLNLYKSSDDEMIKSFCKDKFINGTKYLITQQQPNGGYAQWHWRNSKNIPNLDDSVRLNNINSYATANAIFALENVYEYIRNNNSNSSLLMEKIYIAIKNAGEFLYTKDNSKAHRNYVAFSIWGLINVYKIVKDEKFLLSVLEKYKIEIENYQDSNGAFYKKEPEYLDYHDAHSPYMGIILTSLIDLYNELPNTYYHDIKERLRNSIIKGINHFLLPNIVHENFSNQKIRLAEDGGIYPYSEQKEYTKVKGRALQLSQALIYALKSDDLFSEKEDISRLRDFLNAVMKYQVNETIDYNKVLHINSDIYFESISLYIWLQTIHD